MDLRTIAEALVEACRSGREAELLDAHYAEAAVSVEAADTGAGRVAQGLDAIRGKHAWWAANMEVTGGSVTGPFLHPSPGDGSGDGPDRFAVIFEAQGRDRATGTRFDMREVGLYTVAEGKIVREDFFY